MTSVSCGTLEVFILSEAQPNAWLNQPLALWQGDLRASMMLDWAAGRVDLEAVERWVAAAPARRTPSAPHGIGLVALQGVVMRRPGPIATLLGAVSLDGFMAEFRAHVDDPNVGTILMLIDSPGGEISGLPEVAAEIRAARTQKSVVAFVENVAASAAYWIASQAGEIVVSPSGGVGAIEVYSVHHDISGHLEQEGIKREVIAGGPNKRHGAGGMPLTDDDRADIQAQADEFYAMYVADVATSRGVSVKDVTSGYGKGGYLLAKRAKTAGMIDRVDTLDNTVRRIASGRGRAAMALVATADSDAVLGSGLPLTDRLALVSAAASGLVDHVQAHAAMRAGEGRSLSEASRSEITDIVGSLRSSAAGLEAALGPTPPAPANRLLMDLDVIEAAFRGQYALPATQEN